jgi:hypothetical protein
VALAADGFGDQSAACQEPWPPVGSHWIWIAFIPEPGQAPQVNLCTPKAQIGTPEGEAMLAEVGEVFGPGRSAPPVLEGTAGSPAITPEPSLDARVLLLPLAAAAGVGVVLFGAVYALGRSRRR